MEEPFAERGDSGAIVVDEDECIIGMVVALRPADPRHIRHDDPAFVVPITGLVENLQVSLTGPNRVCTLV